MVIVRNLTPATLAALILHSKKEQAKTRDMDTLNSQMNVSHFLGHSGVKNPAANDPETP